MDLIIKENRDISVKRRKKRDKEPRKSIFEIYRSEKTMKDYFFYLNNFLLFVYDNGEPIKNEEILDLMSDVTEDDINDYLSHLLYERNLKKTSINKIMSGLKSLYNELEKHNVKNPLKHIKLFKTSRNLNNILKLSFEDIKNIFKEYRIYGEKDYRNIVILYTLFYTGMRSQELLNIKYKHILKRDDDYFIKLEKTKSGKEQYKPVHDILRDKLLEYKKYIKDLYNYSDEEIEEVYVISSSYENNTQLSYKSLYSLIQEMGKIVGLNISPHNVRHAIATELSSNGADLLEIRDFLGHADSRVTEIYINAKSLLDKKVISKIPV